MVKFIDLNMYKVDYCLFIYMYMVVDKFFIMISLLYCIDD